MHFALLWRRQSACLSALVPVRQLSVWPRPKRPPLSSVSARLSRGQRRNRGVAFPSRASLQVIVKTSCIEDPAEINISLCSERLFVSFFPSKALPPTVIYQIFQQSSVDDDSISCATPTHKPPHTHAHRKIKTV